MVSIVSNDSYETLVAPTVSEVEALESPIKTMTEISPSFPSFAADSDSYHELIEFGSDDSTLPLTADSDDSSHESIDSGSGDSSPRSAGAEPVLFDHQLASAEAVKLDEQPTNVECVESNHQHINTESSELAQHGLWWEEGMFCFEPRWTVEPEIEDIKKTVYNVKVDGKVFIMRVSLPVDPHFKVSSEVATMNWVRNVTGLPIPDVIHYEPSQKNDIGFKWIFMAKVPGSLSMMSGFRFPSMRNPAWSVKLHRARLPFSEISSELIARLSDFGLDGNSDLPSNETLHEPQPNLGQIVSLPWLSDSRLGRKVSRGPFHSSRDWITARLKLVEDQIHSALEQLPVKDLDESDERTKNTAKRILELLADLNDLLVRFFPNGDEEEPEPSIIFHDDLSRQNFLVNEEGVLTGVIDWEFVSVLPLWKACDYPHFLKGPPIFSKPDPAQYLRGENGELGTFYWNSLWNHEATLLCELFIDELRSLSKGWIQVFDQSQHLRDLDQAIHDLSTEFFIRNAAEWIRDIRDAEDIGNLRSLYDRSYEFYL
ncbi:unnamed protein product [Penicillium salamii]|uniref:Aminoglycoside phosphotransferase domain-containing protein n=1 Tax=Penicillium salamii TaxID=1612424 RepID=A0A9W4JHG4_9EURO|nr:unnamed protein product [Penicillium salamii]